MLGRPHHVEGTLRPAGQDASELVLSGGTALPAPGRYLGRLATTGPVTVRVTDDGRLIVESVPRLSGITCVEFTDRKDP